MKKNLVYQCVAIVACLLFLSSCASNYVGRSVTMDHESVCKFQSLPAGCSNADAGFVYDYKIEETENPREYTISGTAKYVGGQTFTSFSGLSFTLLLVQYGYVTEKIGVAGGAGSLDSTITFSRTFITPAEFDASLFFCSGGNAKG